MLVTLGSYVQCELSFGHFGDTLADQWGRVLDLILSVNCRSASQECIGYSLLPLNNRIHGIRHLSFEFNNREPGDLAAFPLEQMQ